MKKIGIILGSLMLVQLICFAQSASIGDWVWEDTNGNGLQDAGEPGIPGVLVYLGNQSLTRQTTTNALGQYKFENLETGVYNLSFATPFGFLPVQANQGNNDEIDSDALDVNGPVLVTLTSGENNSSYDAGFSNLGSFACQDTVILEPMFSIENGTFGSKLKVAYFITSGESSVTAFQIGFRFDNNIFKFSKVETYLSTSGLLSNTPQLDQLWILYTSANGLAIPIDNKPLFEITFDILDDNGIGFINHEQFPNFPSEFIQNDISLNCINVNTSLFNPNFGFVKGRLTLDDDKNCLTDNNPVGLENWLIVFEQGNKKYYRNTDNLGQFNAGLVPGLYTATAIPPNAYFTLCSQTYNVTIVEDQTVMDINFLGQREVDCAVVTTDITAPFLRRCFDNNYAIAYQNTGTIDAVNATMVVELDDDLTFVSSSRPHTQTGQTINYNLGTVRPSQKGVIYLVANVNCNTTELGETHCVTVTSFPNDPCIIPANYTGSKIVAKAKCNETTGKVTMILTNEGTSATPTALQYIITEDDVMRPPVIYNLGVQQSLQIELDADGTTYGIMTQQEANYPTVSRPSAFVEGCRLNGQGSFSTGFIDIFEQNDVEPFIDILCLQNIGSYDPNDITGFPKGYSNKKYVEKDTKLEYLVRFQNTGSDTAFNIVVRNVIDKKLDLTTFKMKGASHNFTYDFINERELVVKFSNILLVDSNRNEALSHGYFTYEIYPTTDLKDEDRIENLADIYFDFNAPVRTNIENHTIGRPIFLSSITQFDKTIQVHAFPNPTNQSINIDLPAGDYEYDIYDAGSRKIYSGSLVTNSIDCGKLAAGYYTATITRQGKHISTLKFVKN